MKIISFADYLFLTKLMVIKYQIKGDCYRKNCLLGGREGGERSTIAHLLRFMRIGGNVYT